MTDDFIWYGRSGGVYAPGPDEIASVLEKGDIRLAIDSPLELSYLNGREERWPKALDYIRYHTDLYRQWAYRRADGDKMLLQEIDGYVRDLYEWVKQGRANGQLDDIELERLKAAREALTDKLYEYVPERLISGGQSSIRQLLDDIENTEHIERYPREVSVKWYNTEIVRLGLLSEKVELLVRLVEKIHPETAKKYHYVHYLREVVSDIGLHMGVLERSRDELYSSIVTRKIDIQEHLSKICGEIDSARGRIKSHFSELRERLDTGETEKKRQPMPNGVGQGGETTHEWKPPEGYLNAEQIDRKHNVPRSTLQQWQQQDDVADGPLAGRLVKDPGSTHKLYYPEDWVTGRVENWRPKKCKR